jgi:hypothetical protein
MRTKTNLKAGSQSSGAGAGKVLSILSAINSLAASRGGATIMPTSTNKRGENPASLHADKIVCRLDAFPELIQALHDGDLLTGRLFCAQLFDLRWAAKSLG